MYLSVRSNNVVLDFVHDSITWQIISIDNKKLKRNRINSLTECVVVILYI